MDKVRSAEQCKALLAENKKRFARLDSNCLLLTGSMEQLTGAGRLWAETYDGGLCFLADEGRYFDLYHAWDAAAPLPDLRRDRPVLVTEASDRGRMEEKLLAAGFSRLKVSRLYTLDLTEQAAAIAAWEAESLARLAAGGIRIAPCADRTQAAQTAALWLDALDIGDVPEEHLRFPVNAGETVACALNGDGKVIGAYWWRCAAGHGEGRHIVTRRDCLRQGVGSALLLWCAGTLIRGGAQRLTTWISDDNSRSIALHGRVGFRAGDRCVTQYILEGDN